MALGELAARPAAPTSSERVLVAVDCANESRLGPDPSCLQRAPLVVDIDHHHDNTRFGDVNLIVPDASSTGEVLRDVFAELGVAADARDRRGALHRARHRHGPLPVREHDAQGAAAGGRARRGRRGRPPRLPGRLRVVAVREAEAARARARARAGLRGRPHRRLLPAPRRLRRRRRGRAVLGGDHRLPARGRGRGDGGADPRAAARRRAGAARQPARERATSSTSRRSRASSAAAATGRRRVLERDDRSTRSPSSSGGEFAAATSAAPPARPASMPPRGARADRDRPGGQAGGAVVVRDRRRVRRRTGARTGHAGTLDPFATGLLLLLSGRATKLARCFVGLDKRYVTEVDLAARTSTGDPEGDVVEQHEPPAAGGARGAARAGLRGEVELPIPAASAVKIGGERAYRLHRRGVAVEMPLRRSRVDALDSSRIRRAWPRSTCASARARTSGRSPTRSAATAGRCGGLEVGPFSVDEADPERVVPVGGGARARSEA